VNDISIFVALRLAFHIFLPVENRAFRILWELNVTILFAHFMCCNGMKTCRINEKCFLIKCVMWRFRFYLISMDSTRRFTYCDPQTLCRDTLRHIVRIYAHTQS
jgi:hypothetical protein